MNKLARSLQSESGLITVDFMFAMVIAFGMSAILFAMTFTLSMVEIVQYITYSSARAQVGSHADPAKQQQAAKDKYKSLISNPIIEPLFNNGWFEVSSDIEIKGGKNAGETFADDYKSKVPDKGVFTGVRTKFTSKILSLKLPLIGSTSPDSEGFSAKILSVLIREISHKECEDFMKARLDAVYNIDNSRFGSYRGKGTYNDSREDNGC